MFACFLVVVNSNLALSDWTQYRLLNCFAQCQKPSASLLKCDVDLERLYVNVYREFTVQLCNHSAFEIKYQWGKVSWLDEEVRLSNENTNSSFIYNNNNNNNNNNK